ncbi:MAG: zinc-binding dehydrogenase [Anaerolineae bacterium]|nr:zinc-binding dehydrogenase [Anaerolineae bacterium]
MKKAIITGERQASLVEAPDPRPRGEWALVKVHVAPMCTEYKAFLAGGRHEYLGHEAAGEVVEVAQPGRVKVGDRVVAMPLAGCGRCYLCLSGDYIHCQDAPDFEQTHGSREGSATMAQYLLKQDWLLLPIPDDLSYEQASLACCALGPSFGAMALLQLTAFDTILITGLGPVGLGAVVNALFRGARVIAVESHLWRAERARTMGVEAVLDPADPDTLHQVRHLTDGRGVDCSLDCSGTVAAQRLCLEATKRKGRVAFVGECSEELHLRASPDLLRQGLTLYGSWHYNLKHFADIIQVIRRSPLLDLLVSHVLPMSQIQEVFELSASPEHAKILLKPWE